MEDFLAMLMPLPTIDTDKIYKQDGLSDQDTCSNKDFDSQVRFSDHDKGMGWRGLVTHDKFVKHDFSCSENETFDERFRSDIESTRL
jgi:hypothetical protein